MRRLRNAVDVAPVIKLEVLLQVQSKVACGVGRAGYPGQSGLAARRAELLGGVFADFPTAVAAENPGLENGDARKGGVEQV